MARGRWSARVTFVPTITWGWRTIPAWSPRRVRVLTRYGVEAAACAPLPVLSTLHLELERRLAAFKRVEAAVTFQSGFCANLAAIPALGGQRRCHLLGWTQPRQHH